MLSHGDHTKTSNHDDTIRPPKIKGYNKECVNKIELMVQQLLSYFPEFVKVNQYIET